MSINPANDCPDIPPADGDEDMYSRYIRLRSGGIFSQIVADGIEDVLSGKAAELARTAEKMCKKEISPAKSHIDREVIKNHSRFIAEKTKFITGNDPN